MTVRRLALPLFVMLLFGTGCGGVMHLFQSSFFSKFSLRELVDRSESRAGLECSTGADGAGGGGMSMGMGGVGKQESNFSRVDSIACQISDAEVFDEAKFIESLKASVEQELKANNATIVSSKNSDASSFDLEYSISDNATGTVKVSATKGPMRYYTLTADLNEKSK